jgi:hypothetical protein
MTNQNDKDDEKPLTFFELMNSVFAAFIGIQSQENRERDFKKMKPRHVIIAGLLLMVVFFTTVIVITRTILAAHG